MEKKKDKETKANNKVDKKGKKEEKPKEKQSKKEKPAAKGPRVTSAYQFFMVDAL